MKNWWRGDSQLEGLKLTTNQHSTMFFLSNVTSNVQSKRSKRQAKDAILNVKWVNNVIGCFSSHFACNWFTMTLYWHDIQWIVVVIWYNKVFYGIGQTWTNIHTQLATWFYFTVKACYKSIEMPVTHKKTESSSIKSRNIQQECDLTIYEHSLMSGWVANYCIVWDLTQSMLDFATLFNSILKD